MTVSLNTPNSILECYKTSLRNHLESEKPTSKSIELFQIIQKVQRISQQIIQNSENVKKLKHDLKIELRKVYNIKKADALLWLEDIKKTQGERPDIAQLALKAVLEEYSNRWNLSPSAQTSSKKMKG